MQAEDLSKVVWPSCVDIFGQVVVTMAFFFLLVFIILAYYLTQIEISQRVRSVVVTYQTLYEPVSPFIGENAVKRSQVQKRNLDELIVRIEDLIVSTSPERVKEVKSLINRRDKLVEKVHQLGYPGYKPQSLTESIDTMAVLSRELVNYEGKWNVNVVTNGIRISFQDNSSLPNAETKKSLVKALQTIANQASRRTIVIEGFQSISVANLSLRSRQVVARAFALRDMLEQLGINKEQIRIIKRDSKAELPFGGVEIQVTP